MKKHVISYYWGIVLLLLSLSSVIAEEVYPPPPQGVQWGWQGEVLFKINSANIQSQFKPFLDTIVTLLVRYPDKINLLITGRTDNTGDIEYNRKLSLRRIEAISNYLIKQGVLPRQIETQAVGEQRPVSNNACTEDRERNRRTDLAFFPIGVVPPKTEIVHGETQPQFGECEKLKQLQ